MKAGAKTLSSLFDRRGVRNRLRSATFRPWSAVRMQLASSEAKAGDLSPRPPRADLNGRFSGNSSYGLIPMWLQDRME